MEAIRAATWEAQRKAKEELYGCSEGDKKVVGVREEDA